MGGNPSHDYKPPQLITRIHKYGYVLVFQARGPSSLYSSEDMDDSPGSFAICHSERSKESISKAQDKLRENSQYYSALNMTPNLRKKELIY